MSAVLTLGDQHLPVQAGTRTVLTVTIHNDGSSISDYGIRVEGAAGPFATVEPPQLTLFPGAVSTVTVAFAVPADGSVAAGPLPFTVWAVHADGDGAPAAAADGTLDVLNGAPPEFTSVDIAAPVPPVPEEAMPVAMQEIDESSAWAAPVDGTEVTEAEEGAEPVEEHVEPTPLPPPSLSYSLPPPDDIVRHRREPTGRIPRLAAAIGIGFLAMLLVASLLWLAIGRDRVRSIAREEARAASGRPGGGVAGTERPIAGRLFLTGPGEVAFTVPKDRYLQVTDIVLQNPAGNTGTLRVRRDEAILLDVALENFRDLDYHFVTPIELGPTNRLVLEAACTSPPTATGSGCTPSALFSGIFSEAP